MKGVRNLPLLFHNFSKKRDDLIRELLCFSKIGCDVSRPTIATKNCSLANFLASYIRKSNFMLRNISVTLLGTENESSCKKYRAALVWRRSFTFNPLHIASRIPCFSWKTFYSKKSSREKITS